MSRLVPAMLRQLKNSDFICISFPSYGSVVLSPTGPNSLRLTACLSLEGKAERARTELALLRMGRVFRNIAEFP